MKRVGYLRVSTEEQNPDRQIDALTPLCDELHIEKLSAISARRPIFDSLLQTLKPQDTLVVWDLDRAFRSTIDALSHTELLRERGVQFQIVTMDIDTSDPFGEFFFTIVAAFAQLERKMISKRTKEGLAAARKRGKRLGRPPALTPCQVKIAKQKLETNEASTSELATLFDVDPWTITRSIKRAIEYDET